MMKIIILKNLAIEVLVLVVDIFAHKSSTISFAILLIKNISDTLSNTKTVSPVLLQ